MDSITMRFALRLDSNIGFCEHHLTHLIHCDKCDHRVSPSQASVVSQGPSMRSGLQLEMADSLIIDADGAPAEWSNRQVVLTDRTKNGVLGILMQFRRGLLSASEGPNSIYVEGYSGSGAGLHFVPKSCLWQWT